MPDHLEEPEASRIGTLLQRESEELMRRSAHLRRRSAPAPAVRARPGSRGRSSRVPDPPPTPADVFWTSRRLVAESTQLLTRSRQLHGMWARWRATWLALSALPPDDRWLVVCSYCGQVRGVGDTWFEPPKPIGHWLHHPGDLLQVSHGACTDCSAAVETQPPPDPPPAPMTRRAERRNAGRTSRSSHAPRFPDSGP